MKLVVASGNPGKRREIASILEGLGFELVDGEPAVEVNEDADTFAGNARKKALAAARSCGCAAIADDSGLCVDALGDAPGVRSARFAGEGASDAENNARLLAELEGGTNRRARFVCAVCLAYPDGRVLEASGEVEGQILEAPRGEEGFGYDPLFYCPELGKTFAEASPEEKARVSHRGRALRRLAELIASGIEPSRP